MYRHVKDFFLVFPSPRLLQLLRSNSSLQPLVLTFACRSEFKLDLQHNPQSRATCRKEQNFSRKKKEKRTPFERNLGSIKHQAGRHKTRRAQSVQSRSTIMSWNGPRRRDKNKQRKQKDMSIRTRASWSYVVQLNYTYRV